MQRLLCPNRSADNITHSINNTHNNTVNHSNHYHDAHVDSFDNGINHVDIHYNHNPNTVSDIITYGDHDTHDDRNSNSNLHTDHDRVLDISSHRVAISASYNF